MLAGFVRACHAAGFDGADEDSQAELLAVADFVALVQSPDTAEQSGMPRHSIAAGSVYLILSPAEIGAELGRLAHHFTRPDVRSLEEAAPAQIDEQSFRRILQLLRTVSGIELRQYKPETIRRRVARRHAVVSRRRRAFLWTIPRRPRSSSAACARCWISVSNPTVLAGVFADEAG